MDLEEFESLVLDGLYNCKLILDSSLTLVAAVSGGADSISMLTALNSLSKKFSFNLECMTVNHNIREKSETLGDAMFVKEYCSRLNIPFSYYEVPRGKILSVSQEKKIGMEAAAREERYNFFNLELQKHKSSNTYLCLAHNKNDSLETLLMRFLQGGDCSSLSGIKNINQHFIRPMLSVSRAQIEEYLSLLNVSFVTDSTNSDNSMYRNKIRNLLVPVLNKDFEGWEKGVFNTCERLSYDNEVICRSFLQAKSECGFCFDEKNKTVTLKYKSLLGKEFAVFRRIIIEAADCLGCNKRITGAFISELFEALKISMEYKKECFGLCFNSSDGETLNISLSNPCDNVATESCFFVTIREPCGLTIKDRHINVQLNNGQIVLKGEGSEICVPKLEFPFVIRSRLTGDYISAGESGQKSVASILDDWKCKSLKDSIPIIQNIKPDKNGNQPLVCIWGGLYGFKDWICK